ncbi:hypothetical protein GCM10025760_19340 [Microbacterium yannicii]|uniref:Uncharacterized protein n=1 Tax=Microbacterium yannicii TaxID=671622 RepID=A0ABP9M8W3_9MICO
MLLSPPPAAQPEITSAPAAASATAAEMRFILTVPPVQGCAGTPGMNPTARGWENDKHQW